MYIPTPLRENDPEVLLDFVDEFPFATLITVTESEPLISYAPLVVGREAPRRIFGHLARANPHHHALTQGLPTVAIFHGPHAYVSPAWYAKHPSVPTWNYAVVHVYGRPSTVDDAGATAILERLVEKFERTRENRWNGELPEDYRRRLVGAIVGFEMTVEKLEGKFKLNQNKSDADLLGSLTGLENEGGSAGMELAAFTRKYLARPHT